MGLFWAEGPTTIHAEGMALQLDLDTGHISEQRCRYQMPTLAGQTHLPMTSRLFSQIGGTVSCCDAETGIVTLSLQEI